MKDGTITYYQLQVRQPRGYGYLKQWQPQGIYPRLWGNWEVLENHYWLEMQGEGMDVELAIEQGRCRNMESQEVYDFAGTSGFKTKKKAVWWMNNLAIIHKAIYYGYQFRVVKYTYSRSSKVVKELHLKASLA